MPCARWMLCELHISRFDDFGRKLGLSEKEIDAAFYCCGAGGHGNAIEDLLLFAPEGWVPKPEFLELVKFGYEDSAREACPIVRVLTRTHIELGKGNGALPLHCLRPSQIPSVQAHSGHTFGSRDEVQLAVSRGEFLFIYSTKLNAKQIAWLAGVTTSKVESYLKNLRRKYKKVYGDEN